MIEERRLSRLMLIAALGFCAVETAHAQDVEAQKEESEVQLEEGNALGEADTSVLEDAESGPGTDFSWFQDDSNIESTERTETAMRRLRDLVQNTPSAAPERGEYMFRLADLYFGRARYYEDRSYQRQDEAFAIRTENPARADMYVQSSEDDLAQSDRYAIQARDLYNDLYLEFQGRFDGMDAVLFYLGSNNLQLGERELARQNFEELAREYPRSDFFPQGMLLRGEIAFEDGEMQDALDFYNIAINSGLERIVPYATYKKAWVFYNMAMDRDGYMAGLNTLMDALSKARAATVGSSQTLVTQMLRDVPLFYSYVYDGANGLAFFQNIAPDMAVDLSERLGQIFAGQGSYSHSNDVYRSLIALNPESFKTVEYQTEIVRNTQPESTEVETVREIRRLVTLFSQARDYEDATPGLVSEVQERIELLVRQVATTYHREAQVTMNDHFYALSFNLYEDYVTHFGESENAYPIWFYYAELLYRDEQWGQAADAYDKVFEMGDGSGEFDTDATHGACLAYSKTINVERPNASGADAEDVSGDLPPLPEPTDIPPEYTRMMDACDRYLAQEGDAQTETEIEFVVAYLYYEHNQLDEAAQRFAALATSRADVDPERASLAAELMLDSFAIQRNWGAMRQSISELQDSALNTGEFAGRLALLKEQVSFNECRDLQVSDRHQEAGHCFFEFVNENLDSPIVDRAIYNAGVAYREADELDISLSLLEQLPIVAPDSDLVPNTYFQLGQTYRRLAAYDLSAQSFERYAQSAPDGEFVVEALASATSFRQNLGDHREALDDIERFKTAARGHEDADEMIAEATFQTARTQEARGEGRRAVEAYNTYIRQYRTSNPSNALIAYTSIGNIYLASRRVPNAYSAYEDASEFFHGMSEEDRAELTLQARDAAGTAQFMLADRGFDDWVAMPMSGRTADQQERSVRRKLEVAGELEAKFTAVVQDIERAGWAIAGLTRIGQMYQEFHEQFVSLPVPVGLPPMVEEELRTMLEEQAAMVKGKAIEHFQRAIDIAREEAWFNEYSELAGRMMQELDPAYAAGSEIRTEPGFDTPSVYMSVVRVADAAAESSGPLDGSVTEEAE